MPNIRAQEVIAVSVLLTIACLPSFVNRVYIFYVTWKVIRNLIFGK